MTEPKLPPLPPCEKEWCEETHMYVPPVVPKYTGEQMNAHYLKGYNDAIAALEQQRQLEAQGVPDGWSHAGHFYNLVMHALMDVGANHDGARWRLKDILKELESLASAPPAPQAEDCANTPYDEGPFTLDAVEYYGGVKSDEELFPNQGQQADVVQQEPVTTVQLKDGKELVKVQYSSGLWEWSLQYDGVVVRWLDEFESDFVDSAIKAGGGVVR
jgi:hypothetical protein